MLATNLFVVQIPPPPTILKKTLYDINLFNMKTKNATLYIHKFKLKREYIELLKIN